MQVRASLASHKREVRGGERDCRRIRGAFFRGSVFALLPGRGGVSTSVRLIVLVLLSPLSRCRPSRLCRRCVHYRCIILTQRGEVLISLLHLILLFFVSALFVFPRCLPSFLALSSLCALSLQRTNRTRRCINQPLRSPPTPYLHPCVCCHCSRSRCIVRKTRYQSPLYNSFTSSSPLSSSPSESIILAPQDKKERRRE